MPNEPSSFDPVELLLRRIAQRALAGSLFTSAAMSGCIAADHVPELETDETLPLMRAVAATPLVLRSVAPLIDAGVAAPGDRADAGTSDAGAIDTSGFTPFDCEPNQFEANLSAQGLTLREPADYVAIRHVYRHALGEPDAGAETWSKEVEFRTLAEAGEPCKTASTPACAEKVAGHPTQFVPSRCDPWCSEQSLVTTRGDEVRRYAGEDALAQLDEIATADDALLTVSFAGYFLLCNPKLGGVRPVDGGFEVLATQVTRSCRPVVESVFRLFVGRDGSLKELEQQEYRRSETACTGRRAAHVRLTPDEAGRSPLGDYLARSAQLEAASVHAFAQLARELEAHGAPAELVARAWSSRDDEIRHAQEVGALAIARGGLPAEPTVRAQPARSLEEIAIENAVEGCVRETYGALVGAYQAARASDLGLRRAMARIADDEARHAALSHAVHAWIAGKLGADASARVRAAEVEAIGALRRAAVEEPDAMLCELAGLPDAATACALVDQLARELWLPRLQAA